MYLIDGRTRRIGAALVILGSGLIAYPARAQDTALAHPITLGDAARIAARQSASALAARYRAEQASARVTQSRSAFLPTLSLNAIESGRTFNSATFGIPLPGFSPSGAVLGPVRTLDMRGQLSQTIVNFGAVGQFRSARALATASDAQAASAAEQAAAAAASVYLQAQRADAQLAARMADSVLADSLLAIARDQLAAGVGVALDLTRAQAQVATVRAQLIAARNLRDRTRLELLRSLGLPLDANVELADSLGELPISDTLPNEAAALERALRRRPDLRAADEQLSAARQAVSAIRAERLPSLAAFGDNGFMGPNGGNMLNTYTWGVQVTLPIFDGLRREGRVEEQQAASREIEVRLRDLRQQTGIEVRGALLDLASARQQVDATREQLRLAEQELTQARDRFRAGVAGNADVITASLALNGARNVVIDALTAYHSARVALAHAEGAVTALP
jgi:outer membrane protein TolC